jgi:hypothetical protein
MANPLFKYAWVKAGLPVGLWLLKQVGGDWLLRRVELGVDGIGQRQKAVIKARSIHGGRFGSTIIEDRTRWVVFAGEEPRAVFPAIEGDLAEELRGYDLSRLHRPDELGTARARAWAAARIQALRDLLQRGDGDGEGDGGREREGPRAVAGLEQEIGRQAFDALVERMPSLLEELSGRPARPVAAHDSIPAAPGIFLFSEGPTPLYVGNSRNLRRRLGLLSGASSPEEGDPARPLGADPGFDEFLRRAGERVASMDVRFIEIDDPVTRTVFEVYAAQALGTELLIAPESR